MNNIRITKEFRFEMAHALHGYDGACRQIHGHSYILLVTVMGRPISNDTPKKGMVMDFGELKRLVMQTVINKYDHALLISTDTPVSDINMANEMFGKVILVDYQPTSENMLLDFAETLKPLLPEGVDLHSLRLHETASCYAEWYASDNL